MNRNAEMQALLDTAAILKKTSHCIALTGAGISAESGVPPFRGPNGLWSRYDPAEFAHVNAFSSDPGRAWVMFRDMLKPVLAARPNPAHLALARLESAGFIKSIVTQNVDGLHQAAGSRSVLEYHGSMLRLECPACGNKRASADPDITAPPFPRCACGAAMRPDIVLFGESIPAGIVWEGQLLASSCDAILVIGTSGMVQPAAELPFIAKKNRAAVVEFNTAETGLTGAITDVFVRGPAGKTLPALAEILLD
ncbi:MAG TPA: NAD-dependent deacylase [Spirochaetota bacterium]|nr:NAD-dependent deacylase [Spirochaetota bacterium]